MHTKPGQKEPSLLVKFVSAGLAASVAEAATIPIDTAKVRLQVSWSLTASEWMFSQGHPTYTMNFFCILPVHDVLKEQPTLQLLDLSLNLSSKRFASIYTGITSITFTFY